MKKIFTPNQKLKIALEAVKGVMPISRIASEHQVHPNVIGQWKKIVQEYGGVLFNVWKGETKSLQLARKYLGKEVEAVIDRPLGSWHPKHRFAYEVNYGFIEGVKAPDGEDLDAYYLGIEKPIQQAKGICIAIAHRKNDDDDKLIIVPHGMEMTDEQILSAIHFQEQWFETEIVR